MIEITPSVFVLSDGDSFKFNNPVVLEPICDNGTLYLNVIHCTGVCDFDLNRHLIRFKQDYNSAKFISSRVIEFDESDQTLLWMKLDIRHV
ncbi:MAG: hypothetical protein WC284_18805 [Candidimonas sp.]